MSTLTREELLKQIPEIAKAVNEFKSEKLQEKAFELIVGAIGLERQNHSSSTSANPSSNTKSTTSGEGKKKTAPKKSKNGNSSNGKFLDDLELAPKNGSKLIEFMKEKKPNNVAEKMGVCIIYLQSEQKISELTYDHFYTCFSVCKFKVPDFKNAIENDSKRQHLLSKKGELVKLTRHGDNFIKHDLPKNKDK